MDIYRQLFGKKLRQARKATDLTQADLGEKLGVEPSTVSRWESGKDFPTSDRLPAICEALGVDQAYFEGRSPVQEKPAEISAGEAKILELLEGKRSNPEEQVLLTAWAEAGATARAVALYFLTGKQEDLKKVHPSIRAEVSVVHKHLPRQAASLSRREK